MRYTKAIRLELRNDSHKHDRLKHTPYATRHPDMDNSIFNRIRNYRAVDDRLSTSGQPSVDQLREIAEAGFTLVVNLALHDDPRYALPDEAGVVRSLGMRYVHIPVQFSAPTHAALLAFFEFMARHEGETIWVHCAANMRVSAFLGLYCVIRQGWAQERAFALMNDLWQPDATWSSFISSALAQPNADIAMRQPDNASAPQTMSSERNKRILVAGASGAIGRRLCRMLGDDGWSVAGMTRSTDKASMLFDLGVEPVIVDVFDATSLLGVVRKAQPDIVIHQLTDLPPALAPEKMAAARIRNARIREIGTRNLVAAAVAAGVKRMVAQSIAFAYAPGPMPYCEDAPLNLDDPDIGLSARAVASLEQQVLTAPFEGIVLRYGKLYGPGTGFDRAPGGGPLHVDAAADAARRAATHGKAGVYNIAEADGTVSSDKAVDTFGWNPGFRLGEADR